MAEDVKPRFKFLTTDDFTKLSAPERLAHLNKAIAALRERNETPNVFAHPDPDDKAG